MENLAKHVGLFHCKLDELLFNEEFVASKKEQYKQRQIEQTSDSQCKICDLVLQKKSLREHTARHFVPELVEIVSGFKRSNACNVCRYTGKRDSLIKHVALVHGKLDEFLMDEDLVLQKRKEANSEEDLAVESNGKTEPKEEVIDEEETAAAVKEEVTEGEDSDSIDIKDEPIDSPSKKEIKKEPVRSPSKIDGDGPKVETSPDNDLKIVIKRRPTSKSDQSGSEDSPSKKTRRQSKAEEQESPKDEFKITIKRTPKKPSRLREEFITAKDIAATTSKRWA